MNSGPESNAPAWDYTGPADTGAISSSGDWNPTAGQEAAGAAVCPSEEGACIAADREG